MRSLRKFLTRLKAMLRRDRMERDLEDEISFHLEMQIREKVEEGMSCEEAERAVRREFGRPSAVKEKCRDVRLLVWFESVWQDVRFGFRSLAKARGFAFVAVLSLTIGIGATTTIYSAVQAVLFRGLPYEDPDGLVAVRTTIAAFSEWERTTRALDVLAAITFWGSSETTIWPRSEGGPAAGGAERIEIVSVTLRALDVLGVPPAIGRAFESSDLGRPTVVISDRLWRRYFDADPNIIGSPLGSVRDPELARAIVVGVMPRGFYTRMHPHDNGFDSRDIWSLVDPSTLRPTNTRFTLVGRLRPGASIAEAQAELGTIWARVEETDPAHGEWRRDTYGDSSPTVASLHAFATGDRTEIVWMLFAAVSLVLLIACANISCLLLSRAEARRSEIAGRFALGAGRLRIVRQLFTESVILAGLGGGFGSIVALGGVALLKSIAPSLQFGGFAELIRLDGYTLGFTLLCGGLAAALSGLAPAVRAAGADLHGTLREQGRGSIQSSHSSLRRVLVVAEIGLALTLVIGAGLMVRSLTELLFQDPGFQAEDILVVEDIILEGDHYMTAEAEGERKAVQLMPPYFQFFESLLTRVQETPGVVSAALNATIPSRVTSIYSIRAVGRQAEAADWSISAQYHPVTADYFKTLGIALLRGRLITGTETVAGPRHVVISRSTAERLFGQEDPIGAQIQFRIEDWQNPGTQVVLEQPRTVVGVVEDVGYTWRRRNDHWAVVYLPYRQVLERWPGNAHWPASRRDLIIRTTGEDSTAAVSAAVREAIQELDPRQVVAAPAPLNNALDEWVAEERFWAQLLGAFAGMAMFLAAIGLYGTISYSSARRTHEFGIRMALGAQGGDVLRSVLGEAIRLTAIGLGVGVLGAFALTRFLGSQLYGVAPTDPATFVAAALLLGCVAVLAGYLPARRATKTDPLTALRHE